MSAQPPQGHRFSHVYLGGGELLQDSLRMRRRLFTLIPQSREFGDYLTSELGLVVVGIHEFVTEKFFLNAELPDILDTVTITAQYFAKSGGIKVKQEWILFVRRTFLEERVTYRIDDLGGVHFLVDTEFEVARAATVAALQGSRYANSLSLLESAYQFLDNHPPDGKSAIRSLFASVEGLFRLIYPSAQRLGASEITTHFKPNINSSYDENLTARRVLVKMTASFQDWVDAAHFYRHEQGEEDVVQPPLEVAILLISQGTGFLRWLAQRDRERSSK